MNYLWKFYFSIIYFPQIFIFMTIFFPLELKDVFPLKFLFFFCSNIFSSAEIVFYLSGNFECHSLFHPTTCLMKLLLSPTSAHCMLKIFLRNFVSRKIFSVSQLLFMEIVPPHVHEKFATSYFLISFRWSLVFFSNFRTRIF